MKRMSLLVLALAVLATAGCTEKTTEPTPDPEPEPGPTNILRVYSTPPGASIVLNGVETSRVTPYEFDGVPVGYQQVTVQLYGYYAMSDSEYVSRPPGTGGYLSFRLTPIPQPLTVTSSPSGAVILLEHTATGQRTPATFDGYEADTVFVRCMAEGYFPAEDSIIVLGTPKNMHLTLTPLTADNTIVYKQGDSLMTVGLDGMDATYLMPMSGNSYLRWAPDFQHFALITSDEVIEIRDRNGNLVASHATAGGRSSDFSWSPDGTMLAHGQYGGGIFVCDVTNGAGFVQRTAGYGTYHHNPVFSPDNTKIAFTQHAWESKAWIFLMNTDGSELQQISDQLARTSYDEHLGLRWVSASELYFDISSAGLFVLTVGSLVPEPWTHGQIDGFSPDRTKYLTSYAGAPIAYGDVGIWVPTSFGGRGYSPLWSPTNDALATSDGGAIWWTALGTTTSYRIVDKIGWHSVYLKGFLP